MGTGSFLGVKSGRGVTLTTHPLLLPWSRKSRAIPLLPLWAVRPVQSLSACTRIANNIKIFRFSCTVTNIVIFRFSCTVTNLKVFRFSCTVTNIKIFRFSCTVTNIKIFRFSCTVTNIKIFRFSCTVTNIFVRFLPNLEFSTGFHEIPQYECQENISSGSRRRR